MRVRASDLAAGTGPLLQRQEDARVAADKPKARISAALDHLGREMQRRRAERGEGALPRCEWCRWGTAVEALHTRLIRCELTKTGNLPAHSCADFEREPGADDGQKTAR